MSDSTPPPFLLTIGEQEMAGIARAVSGLVSVRAQMDAAMIVELGADFLVTLPDARVSSAKVELTSEQVDALTIRGRLESLSTDAVFREFGLETKLPYSLRVLPGDIARFVVGGLVSGASMSRPLYVIAPPEPKVMAGRAIWADVLLDVERPG